MPDQVASGAVGLAGSTAAVSRTGGAAAAHSSHHGRPVSWVAVSLIMLGFLVGGLGMVFGPTWWVVWAGGAVAVVGGLLGAATHIADDWY